MSVRRKAAIFLLLPVVYFAAGKLGLLFAYVDTSVSPVWPATGVALGSLLALGLRFWPSILIGAFLVNLSTNVAVLPSLAIACGETLEAVAGAWLVMRYANGAACFARARDIFRFGVLAAAVATLLSASIGVTTLTVAGLIEPSLVAEAWLTWWLGDAFGALTTAPFVVQWLKHPDIGDLRGRMPELGLIAATLVGTALAVFVLNRLPLAFITLPPLAWVAFRFSQREVATAIALLSTVAILGTLHGAGPFAVPSQNLSFLLLQAFIGTVAAMMLSIAALVAKERATALAAMVANRSKDDFLAMLSHELRNPLHALASAAAVLQHPVAATIPSASAVQIIRRQTDHLSRMVVDLLDVARARSGTLNFAPQPTDLAVAVQKAMDELAAQGHRQTHAITASTEPTWVLADPVRLHQILRHLLSNAVKFTPAGGFIRISTQVAGATGMVRIEDSGIGMAPALLRRIFVPFAQGDRGIDRREGGLGLGLNLVRHFVEQQGGSVGAESPGAGRGSTFTVRLPTVAAPPLAAAAPAQPATGLRVLVVEDNADARASLMELLKAVGHEVFEAADGRRGVEQAVQHRPHVGLIDIGLPEMDGYEVARLIHAQSLGVRLIALSGYARPTEAHRVNDAGFEDYLVKPVALEQLLRALAGQHRTS